MKTLVVSDLHLLKFRFTQFDRKKLAYLKDLFSKADRIIINGDLWCSYTNTFGQFYKSKWRELFPILKEKHTIYISGNHDDYKYFDERMYEFCDQYVKDLHYKDAESDKKYYFIHGHQMLPQKYSKHPGTKGQFWSYAAQKLVFKVVGVKAHRLFHTKISKFHKIFREWIKDNLKKNEILVVGHTHLPEFDLDGQFINTGFIAFGFASYLWIEDGNPQLRIENYK